jgi:1-acyl-sn-glycerol-3-phosphate acyltransferase
LYKIGKFICWLYCMFFIRLKVSGRENIPKIGGFILASNHLSYLDPLVLGFACPRDLNFMAKEELFHNPIFGRIIRSVGAFPVKRKTADLHALKEAVNRVKSGKGLVVFPEGGRGNGQGIQQPEAGVGFLAAKANAPVIPAFIKGTEQALPKGSKSMKAANVSVVFGRQISVERRVPYQSTAQLIMESICNLSN